MNPPSIRVTLAFVLGSLLLYMVLVFGGLWGVTFVQTRSMVAATEPLRQELILLDRDQVRLDSLASAALRLAPGDRAQARQVAGELARTPREGMSVRAQWRPALPPEIRTALGRMAQPESELPARIRELTAVVETGDESRYFSARERILAVRTELANATRRVELLALEDLARREDDLQSQLRWLQYLLIISGIPVVLLLASAYQLLNRRLLSPLEALGDAVVAVQAGNLDRELAPARSEEMQRLGMLFERMRQGLRERAREEAVLRRTIREDLRRSEDLFRQVIQHAAELILVLDGADGRILFASPSWATLADVPPEPVGLRLQAIMDDEDAEALDRVVDRVRVGEGGALRIRLLRNLGGMGTFDFVFSGLDGDQILAVARDVTSVLEEEERLRRSSRMEAVGQLTGGVAHDFNNLLTVIQGNLDLLNRSLSGAASNEQNSLLRSLDRATDRAAGLTRSLLAFARRQTLREEVVDLRVALENLDALLRRVLSEEISVTVTTPVHPVRVRVDRAQLESALLNLALNARDAMPRGGELTIGIRELDVEEDSPMGRELGPGAWAAIEVGDTGAGMSPQTLARAFEPFFTTKDVGAGSGLGLSMVYGFVNQSGGTVRIDSVVERGTRVSLFFPRLRGAPEADSDTAAAETPSDGDGERILVVEDDLDVRRVVVQMLEDLGYRTHAVATGAEALQEIRHGGVGLVFSDVVLPGGMDGAELSRAIRATAPDLPVLLTSGYPREALMDREGIHDVEILSKPYDQETLGRAIRAALEGATS